MADVSESVLYDAGQIRNATIAALPNLKKLMAENHMTAAHMAENKVAD
jgi:hypothetical protein